MQRLDRKNPIFKHIYPTKHDTYIISKSIKNHHTYFKICKTLDEAIMYRDRLRENNWRPLPDTEEEIYERNVKKYYSHIQIHTKRYYGIRNRNDEYIGICRTIEEALWFRDQYWEIDKQSVPRPRDLDLLTDNPYIKEGLKYSLPDRLILPERNSTYGTGTIVKKGYTSFHIHHGKKGDGLNSYVCACPTIEMAEYVKAEMNKVNWDRSKLQQILDEYPKYYTRLLYFYQYVSKHIDYKTKKWTGKWAVVPPLEYNDGKLEKILYRNLEDALYERDFLKEHDWDYDLLVEVIDDSKNPYYEMDLPTYPTRKIKNISDRDYHEKELEQVAELIQLDFSQKEICEKLNITTVTLRNWLRKFWNSNFTEFKRLVLAGENPLEVLERKEIIIQPDLSRKLPNNWNNWVTYNKGLDRYTVQKGGVAYGTYKSEELAHKISRELQKCNWDKSKLKSIQAKYGHVSLPYSKRWVYRQGKKWAVRRNNENHKMITYGAWHDKRIAVIARDMYVEHGFDIRNSVWINEMAEWIVEMQDLLYGSMFGRVTVEDIAYLERESKESLIYKNNNRYAVVKNNVYYGSYSTEEKAIMVRDFLINNDWDKELLNIMEDIGEI